MDNHVHVLTELEDKKDTVPGLVGVNLDSDTALFHRVRRETEGEGIEL